MTFIEKVEQLCMDCNNLIEKAKKDAKSMPPEVGYDHVYDTAAWCNENLKSTLLYMLARGDK